MLILLNENLKTNNFRKSLSHKDFIEGMTDDEFDWQTKIITRKNLPVFNNLPEDKIYHQSYLTYLEICWDLHYGAVVSPDIIWQGLLCELALIVNADPKRYRHLFTDSEEKKELIVITAELEVMPLNLLIDLLKANVPTNSEIFLPKFNTTTERSLHAFSAAFCDMCSPYYKYSMMLCGIPSIRLDGTEEDWRELLKCWERIGVLFDSNKDYFYNVRNVLENIVHQFKEVNINFWEKMFALKPCGSGSQVEVEGWITKFYLKTPHVRYTTNFSTHTSSVKYKQLNTGKKYDMRVGLFHSALQDGLLVPDFGFSVMEVLEEPIKFKRGVNV